MTKSDILVIDDDESTRTYMLRLLTSLGYEVECLASAERVMARIESPDRPSLMLLDVVMPAVGGLDVLAQMAQRRQRVPTIVVSGVDRVGTAVQAMKLGASDYLLKPFDDEELDLAIRNALRDAAPATEAPRSAAFSDFTSASPRMARIMEIAERVADSDVPVLILGESGVGKEVLARHIHNVSVRRDRPFVKVNCAALPADLLESELFGYERGAFTGALREKQGKFELADGGAILLDEIGEMSPLLQAKLLHVLQDGEFPRLGSTRVVRVDARVLATTNRKLEDAVAAGQFRLDLLYRLNVIRLEIPPLRERPEDITRLSDALLNKYVAKYNNAVAPFPPTVVNMFRRYDWPGNVRQLENVIRRYVVLGDMDLALSDIAQMPVEQDAALAERTVSLKEVSAVAAEQAEKEMVLRLLAERNWNRKQVAGELGICYKSLLNKLHRWRLPTRGPGVPDGPQRG